MSTNNWTFIIAAYTVAWLGIAGYWIFVHVAIRRAREEYDRAIAAAVKTAGAR
jgi:uncharacterized membrane protein (DUF485 family)